MQVNLSMTGNNERSVKEGVRKIKASLRPQGGVFRTAEALKSGIHPRTLYALRDQGVLERLGRGMYRLADLPTLGNPDLTTVALKAPKGVLCLISALAWHELTTEIPHEVYLALPRGAEPPRLEHPPLRIFWFQGAAFAEGVETHEVDGIPVRIYSPEKTLADCFKYRNKIGLDVALEALREAWHEKRVTSDDIWRYAKVCRVANVMRPYLESLG